jgi:hypothetical protein
VRCLGLLLLVLLGVGCTGAPVKVWFEPTSGGLLGAGGARVQYMEVDPSLYGRGCVAVEVTEGGQTIHVTVQQDGTTDWIVGRALPSAVREGVTAAMAFLNGPFDVIKAALGREPAPPPPPSEIHGCGGLFDD